MCCDGSLEPMEPLRPAPARLYVRRRDLRPPMAIATCVIALFAVLASLGIRRSAAGLASPVGTAAPGGPYRAPGLADDNAARAMRRHAARLLAVVGLVVIAQLLCGVAVARWAQIVR